MNTSPPLFSIRSKLALALVTAVALGGASLQATTIAFDHAAESDASVMDATDPAHGRWFGSDKVLQARRVADGVHLVTPPAFPGPWLSTVFAPSPAVLGGDPQARGLVRVGFDLRLDAEPARRPSGNTLILLIGVASAPGESGHAVRLNLKDDGSVFYVGGGVETRVGDAIAAGAWTSLSVEIDFDAQTLSLRSGDAPAVSGFPFSSTKPRSTFGRIEFKTDGGAATYRPLSLSKLSIERLR